MRSPLSPQRTMTKCPGRRARAISGDWTTNFTTLGLKYSLLTILYIVLSVYLYCRSVCPGYRMQNYQKNTDDTNIDREKMIIFVAIYNTFPHHMNI